MDRVSVAVVVVSAASVAVSVFTHGDPSSSFGHGCLLVLPLACVVWPEVAEAAFRMSWQGQSRGGSPAPASLVRVAASLLLAASIAVHHFRAFV